jgi:hypothetical protein
MEQEHPVEQIQQLVLVAGDAADEHRPVRPARISSIKPWLHTQRCDPSHSSSGRCGPQARWPATSSQYESCGVIVRIDGQQAAASQLPRNQHAAGARIPVMAGELPDWRHERRRLPAHLMAEAAANPGGSVAEIDGVMVTDPDGYVPLEAIIGFYVIGPDGRATGEYLRNPSYGAVRDDFARLESPGRWLGWLPGEPGAAIRAQLEELLARQVAGSVVEWVKVIDEPAFLATAVRPPAGPGQQIVRRAAVAVPFAPGVRPPAGRRSSPVS